LDGLAKESSQMYAQGLNAVASDLSGRVAVEERLKAVGIEIVDCKVDFNHSQLPCMKKCKPDFNHLNRTSTVPRSF